jgi:hypothetical protein
MNNYTLYFDQAGKRSSVTFRATDVFVAYMLFNKQYPGKRAKRIEGRN